MTRWKLTLEYDGTRFVGWQRQLNGLSVQQVVEEALSALTDEEIHTITAGRTDAGVHARGQVVHCDIEGSRATRDLCSGVNYYLRKHPVVAVAAEQVPDTFCARRSAIERHYLYRILNRRSPSALERHKAWHVPQALNVAAMHEAAQVLVGHHDFTSFRATQCQAKSPIRTLEELTVTQNGEIVEIRTRARSFLHHQVRNMVGTLALVGRGKWTRDDVRHALDARDRAAGGPTCPPDGLYFMAVRY